MFLYSTNEKDTLCTIHIIVIYMEGSREMKRKVNPDGETRLVEEERESKEGHLHADNLFDENEDFAGEKVDLATGKPIDNSTATSEHIDGIVTRKADQAPIGKVVEAEDAAERWLRENDPTHPGYTGPAVEEDEAM